MLTNGENNNDCLYQINEFAICVNRTTGLVSKLEWKVSALKEGDEVHC